MATVKLRVYPPLTYRLCSQRAGILVLEEAIHHGETLGDLLDRLSAANPGAWQDVYDARARQLRPVIVTLLNGTGLANTAAARAPLSDGDQITFQLVYGGG